MFTDPQSITISAATTSLPRVSSNGSSTRYSSADGAIQEFVSHTIGKRQRSVFALTTSKYAADPLFPVQNTPYSITFKVFRDAPLVGYTVAEQKAAWDGFLAQLAASSGALTTQFFGGQS
jgi:hypothetical protein